MVAGEQQVLSDSTQQALLQETVKIPKKPPSLPRSHGKKAISLMLADPDRKKESLPKDIGQSLSIYNMTNMSANNSNLIWIHKE